MSNAYITITDSSSNAYRFRVARDGYAPTWSKTGQVQVTVTGKVDYQVGPVLRSWQLDLLVAGSSDPAGSDYGDMADLRTFYQLNDPDGTPTNVLTLTDHYGNTHSVYMIEDMIERPITPHIDGACSWFRVTVSFTKTEAE